MNATRLDDQHRWDEIESAIGSIEASGHEWDPDLAVFVCAINVEEVIRGLRPGEEVGARRLFNGMLMAPLGAKAIWLAVGGASLWPAASR